MKLEHDLEIHKGSFHGQWSTMSRSCWLDKIDYHLSENMSHLGFARNHFVDSSNVAGKNLRVELQMERCNWPMLLIVE
jgi:hypothetical protein